MAKKLRPLEPRNLALAADLELEGAWQVEYFDSDGAGYIAIFVGQSAEVRAESRPRLVAAQTSLIEYANRPSRPGICGSLFIRRYPFVSRRKATVSVRITPDFLRT
jgi:hypothetical protein